VAGHLDISAAIRALETFGDINIVSNPSIRVKHAKPAIISVGTSISYIKSTSTTILDGVSRDLVSAVETAKVFDGLILGVVPFIQDSGKISLLINPIKSDVDKESLVLVDVGTQQVTLPVVNIKEVNSTITLNSGDAIILGGLIDNRDVLIDRGVPGLSAIPGLGYLFKDQFIRNENRELVIILSVTEI
jgi:type II secretory pathway component GspD/PulD (secretin)